MPLPDIFPLLAQSSVTIPVSPGDISVIKVAIIILPLLWTIYLLKEIFHKPAVPRDPQLDTLIATCQALTVQVTALNVKVETLTKDTESAQTDIRDVYKVMNGIRMSLSTLAADHARLEGHAEAHAHHAASPPTAAKR